MCCCFAFAHFGFDLLFVVISLRLVTYPTNMGNGMIKIRFKIQNTSTVCTIVQCIYMITICYPWNVSLLLVDCMMAPIRCACSNLHAYINEISWFNRVAMCPICTHHLENHTDCSACTLCRWCIPYLNNWNNHCSTIVSMTCPLYKIDRRTCFLHQTKLHSTRIIRSKQFDVSETLSIDSLCDRWIIQIS